MEDVINTVRSAFRCRGLSRLQAVRLAVEHRHELYLLRLEFETLHGRVTDPTIANKVGVLINALTLVYYRIGRLRAAARLLEFGFNKVPASVETCAVLSQIAINRVRVYSMLADGKTGESLIDARNLLINWRTDLSKTVVVTPQSGQLSLFDLQFIEVMSLALGALTVSLVERDEIRTLIDDSTQWQGPSTDSVTLMRALALPASEALVSIGVATMDCSCPARKYVIRSLLSDLVL